MAGKMSAVGRVVGRQHRLIFVHADLVDDDVLFHGEIVGTEAGTEDVGQDVDRFGQIFRQNGGVEDRVLFAGEGVVMSADTIEVTVDVESRPPWRAFEDHLLQKVRDAGNMRPFISRTYPHKQPYGYRPSACTS